MMTLFLVLVLGLMVARTFAAVSTKRLLPMIAFTWDGRLLTPNQVFNRESLRRVVQKLVAEWPQTRRSTLREIKRWTRLFGIGLVAYGAGYLIAVGVHVVALGVLWVIR